MDRKTQRYLQRHPAAMVKYAATGQTPPRRPAPSTPLRELIKAIPRRFWRRFGQIRLGRQLGFVAGTHYHCDLTALYRFLGGDEVLFGTQSLPYQQQQLAYFRGPVRLDMLLTHCQVKPCERTLVAIERHLPPLLRRKQGDGHDT